MKHPSPSSSDPLPNPRHEAFAREVASGKNATQAYTSVYTVENRRVASTGGHRLMRRKCVAARIKAIQQAGAANVAMDLQEIHNFLTRVVRTPAGMIIPSSDLCTRVKHTRDGATDVWMPDKLACLRLSAKLQGFLDNGRLAQTASPARTDSPAQFDPTKQPITADGDVRIMTEERRALLMAKKRAVVLRRLKQAEEERLAEEQRSVAPERPNQDHQSDQNPTRQSPIAPAPPQTAPARPGVAPRFGGTKPDRPKPPAQPAPPAHLAWAAYPVSANSARPIHPGCRALRPAPSLSPPVPRQQPRTPSRVSPQSSSQIIII